MPKVGFIGVGHMGGPMARNLIKAGHSLKVYDLSEVAVNLIVRSGPVRNGPSQSGMQRRVLSM